MYNSNFFQIVFCSYLIPIKINVSQNTMKNINSKYVIRQIAHSALLDNPLNSFALLSDGYT